MEYRPVSERRKSVGNWKQKTVIRILLLVAKIVNDEPWISDEIKSLSNHIAYNWAESRPVEGSNG